LVLFKKRRLLGIIVIVMFLTSLFQVLLPDLVSFAAGGPTQGIPLLVSSGGTNSIHESLIASNQSTAGLGRVTNVYNWYKNGVSYTNLLMPFESNNSAVAEDYSGYGNNGNVTGVTWTPKSVVGGAYNFNGVNSSITVQNSMSLGGNGNWSEISIEFWVNPAAPQRGSYIIARKMASNSTGSYVVGFQRSSREPANTLYWDITTNDGDDYSIYDTTATVIPTGVWTHVVCTFRSDTGLTIYINGTQAANRSVQATIEGPTSNPLDYEKDEQLFIGYSGDQSNSGGWLNGTLDDVRIYPKKLTPDQITQLYAETKDGLSNSSIIVPQELNDIYQNVWKCEVIPNDGTQDGTARFSNPLTVLIFEPVIQNQNPTDRAFQVSTSLTRLLFKLVDYQGKPMNFYLTTSPNIGYGNGNSVANGTTVSVSIGGLISGTKYAWQLNVTDGSYWTNKTYTFNTALITLKWVTTGLPHGFSGAVIGPLFKGVKEEDIIQAGIGSVSCLNGTNGKVIWTYNDSAIGFYCQPQMADLNKDGNLEIIVTLEFPAGCLVLFGNGTRDWKDSRLDLAGSITSSPVVADVDGNGYPTIFIGAQDILTYNGAIFALRGYDGQVLRSTWAYRPCSGGFSIADTRNDGNFTLFMGDRAAGDAINETTGQSIGGQGLRALDARTFQSLWNRTDILCSSATGIPADVNNDGILEVVIENLRDRVYVLNATDGSTINATTPTDPSNVPSHYKPTVADIDGDGHLEFLLADGEHGNTPSYILVLDLVTFQRKATIDVGLCTYPPSAAPVTGDGTLDMLACNYTALFIIDGKTDTVRDMVGGLTGRLNYAVVQDIDGDGLNEIVVQSSWGRVYAFDTPATRPTPRPRSEVQYYGEQRHNVEQYEPLPGSLYPVIYNPLPINGASNVSTSLNQLSFTLTDFQKNLMNYTVTTSPNIGTGLGVNVGNGLHTVSVSKLQPSTSYTWKISVTDGAHWTNETLTFTTSGASPAVPWWNTGWLYRRALTIGPVAANQVNYSVLVDFTDASLSGKAQSNGNDFVFTDANQVKLDHQIESYDPVAGHLVAWVRVPLLSSTTPTTIYLYYGNSTCPSQQNPTGVWDASYVLVLHLNETSGTQHDSTINVNNATPVGGVTQGTVGKIGGADTFDGSSGYLSVSSSSGLTGFTAFTASFWVNLHDTSRRQTFLNKYDSSGNQRGWAIDYDPSQGLGLFISSDGINFKYWYARYTLQANQWYYVAVVCQSGSVPTFYVNGAAISTTFSSGTATSIFSNTSPLYIGKSYVSGRNVNGVIDEICISNVARSGTWIATGYGDQNNPSNFYTVGSEENNPSYNPSQPPVISNPLPANGSSNVLATLSQLSFDLTAYQGKLMNYTVTTFPNVGSGSGVNVGNNTYNVGVSNLQPNTLYSWNVSVTDGVYWTNATFTFRTQGWYTGWLYRRALTIGPVAANQVNYSVLVDFTDASLSGKAQSNGNDFVFTDANQVKLDHQIESYDPVAGHLVAWVRVPLLSSTTPTTIYLYYGNSTCPSQQNPTGVWDASYVLVLHLNETSGTQHDSTINVNNATPVGGVTQGTVGKIGGADTFDGSSGYLSVSSSSGLTGFTAFTASFWVNLHDTSRRQTFLNKYDSSGNQRGWAIDYDPSQGLGLFISSDGINFKYWYARYTLQANQWYYVAVVCQSGSVPTFYVNGTAISTTYSSGNAASVFSNTAPLYIGKSYASGRNVNGVIDEVCVSNVARSVAWIATNYANQNNPSGFYTVGAEEAQT